MKVFFHVIFFNKYDDNLYQFGYINVVNHFHSFFPRSFILLYYKTDALTLWDTIPTE